MDFQISTSAFVGALAQVADIAAEKKSTMPILSCALLSVEQTPEGGRLAVTAYDLEIGMVTEHSCEIKKPGKVALPAKTLLEVAKSMPSPVTRIKLVANNRVEITSGAASFRLAGQNADDFPTMPEVGATEFMPTGSLYEALSKVAFAMSHDETRYSLNGVFLDLPKGKAVATDGHRLCAADLTKIKDASAVIISKKAVAKLRKLLSSGGESVGEFAVNDSSLLYRRPGTRLLSRLIDGQFPDYTQVLPSHVDAPVSVKRVALRDALSRVMLMAQDKSSAVNLAFGDGSLTVAARNPEEGDASDTVETSGAVDLKINLNGHYLLDMLNVADSESVELHLGDELTPVMVIPEGDVTHTYVLMPMRG